MSCWLEKAKRILNEGGCTLALINGEKQFTSTLMGIAPVLELLEGCPELLSGASVADKVVGKAAALLFIYGGVKQIYADVISTYALSALESAGVSAQFSRKVPFIKNRAGDGMCPMEKKVLDIDDASEGYEALRT